MRARLTLALLTALTLAACGTSGSGTRGDGTVTRTSDIVKEPRPKAPASVTPPADDSPVSEQRDWR